MTRGPAPGSVGFPKDEIARIACEAWWGEQSMANAVAEHFGVSNAAARNLISRARKAGFTIPYQLGWQPLRPVPECGTSGAYSRHLARGEEPCEDCRREHAARAKRYRETGSERVPVEFDAPASSIVLQCECGWTSDNATAMVWHCRTIHGRRATVQERTPKVSL